MANDDTTKAVSAKSETAAEEVQSFDLTLDEFCARLSTTDKRVELIGAFHFSEKLAGTIKDGEAAFAKRYAEFVKKPA